MSHPDIGPGPQSSGSEEATVGTHSKQDRQGGSEIGLQPGNGSQQIPTSQVSNTHMMKQGPASAQMPQHTGASPQQQLPTLPQQAGHMPGHHFPNVPTTSQSSRPKTPNRASPRPYHHPLTPSNRPPSTEPSEINLSPERLNASIAGLFPPKINIPLPPRQPNLNRGFDQQGLNPTTLKAIGQAPPTLTLTGNNGNGSSGGNNTNNQQSLPSGVGVSGTKQEKVSGGQSKRASPSNSRRSSPASSRKSATPSPGRQKGAKMSITCPPHQQQLVNPQGQAMILSPSSVPPSPVSMLSQVSGSTEAQQMQSALQGSHGNPVDGVRENQGTTTTEQQHIPQSQSLRDLSASRMTNVHAPRQPKADMEGQAGTVERPLTQPVPTHNPDLSSTFRTTPTSLNQLLDNTAVSNKPIRPSQSPAGGKHSPKPTLESDVPLHSNSQSTERSMTTTTTTTSANEPEPKPLVQGPTCNPNLQQLTSVPSSHSANNVNTNTTLSFTQTPNSSFVNPSSNKNATPSHCNSVSTNTNATTGASLSTVTSSHNMSASAINTSSNSSTALNLPSSALKPSPSPKPVSSVHSVIQIPASSTTISSNQITVFVTSNPITSTPTSMVSTMMAAANKNTRPQDIRQQSPGPRPQFITTTPVFINPIFQVPGSSVAPNTSVVSQSVTMVGSIQMPTGSIQLSPALNSTQPSGVNIATSQPNRTVVGQVQIATNAASTTPVGSLAASHQTNPGTTKAESQNETTLSQKSIPAVWKPPPHSSATSSPFQTPLSSPPCSSSGTVSSYRKSPISPSPAQAKGKSAPAAVSSTGESLQGFMGTAPSQVFLPPASLATQTEARSPNTTASTANNPLSVVSSPVPVSAQASVPNQILGSASMPPTASLPNSTVNSQASMPTVVGTSSGVTSAALLSTVTLVQSTVPSVVPIVAAPASAEVTHTSPVADPSRVLPVQSDPPTAEPSTPQAAVSAEATRILPGNNYKHVASQRKYY